LVEGSKADFISYAILFAILLFLAIFTIMNTLTITVFERIPEIGTVRAIGMSKGQIKFMFFSEGLIIAIIGILIGWVLALYPVYYLNVYGITMAAEAMEKLNYAMDANMKSMNIFYDWIIASIICILTGVIGMILPSLRAAKTNIVDALKRGVK